MNSPAVLHVEDDDASAFLFRSALDEADITASVYRVSSAEHAMDFLQKVNRYERAKTPRLIVVDLTLPQHDGYWLLTEIQKHTELRCVPVVVLGVEPVTNVMPRVLSLGARSYIEKPYDFNLFVRQVRETLLAILDSEHNGGGSDAHC